MSWPNGNFPPTEASVFFNNDGRHLQRGQVSNIDIASMLPLDLTVPPAPTEALVLSNMNGSHLHHGQEITPIVEQNTHLRSTLNQENKMVNRNVENSSRIKRRKLKSKVWDEFTKHEGEDGKEWAKCSHCQKKFVGSSKSGTTHLKNHLERCPSKRNPSGGADKSVETSNCLNSSVVIRKMSMVGEESNHLDNKRMIIKYWVPLKSIKDDIINVYQEEKVKLRRYLNKLPCRFSLSLEAYMGYEFMVLYFIDDNWELKKRIIHLTCYEDILKSAKRVLVDLWIDENIIYMVDCRGHEDRLLEMNTWFRERQSMPFLGSCACILYEFDYEICAQYFSSVFARKVDVLKRYVKMTSSNENKLQIAVYKAKSMGKKVISPYVPNGHFLAFETLEWVIGVKEAFSELEHMDPDFKSINLKKEEWDDATSFYEFWKSIKDVKRSLSDCKYKTANVYFPMVCNLFLKLVRWEKSADQCKTASLLRNLFEQYWSNFNLILEISVILDPRFKMEIVELWYKEIFGDNAEVHLDKTIDAVSNIYNEYVKGINSSKSYSNWDHGDTNSSTLFEMLDAMGSPYTSPQHLNPLQSELDHYLKGFKCDRVEEFDILTWWRYNTLNYPTLARMARDVLAIPLNGFNERLDSFLLDQLFDICRDKDLDDDIIQLLVHTKVWLYDLENK